MASPETAERITPEELAKLRPDIAAMRAAVPQPGPSAVAMQNAAQRDAPAAGAGQGNAGLVYFEYGGRRWYLTHTPDAFDLADLAEYMDQAVQAPIAALGGINRMLRLWLADFDGLRALFRTRLAGQDMDAQMLAYGELAAALFESATARPTEAPAATSDGRTPTSTSSKDGSPSPAPSPSTAPSGSGTSIPG